MIEIARFVHAADWPTVLRWRAAKFAEMDVAPYPVQAELQWQAAYREDILLAVVGYVTNAETVVIHEVYCADSSGGRRAILVFLEHFERAAAALETRLVFAMPPRTDHSMIRHLAAWGYVPAVTLYCSKKEIACPA
jgi:hypothetical protein